MRKTIVITVLALLLTAATVWAATTDFVADSDITISSVNFNSGSSNADLLILNGSKAASWSYNNGVFTVTNPDATAGFKVGSSDTTVESIQVLDSSGNGSACAENTTPGTSYVSVSDTADTYTVRPTSATACTDLCAAVAGAASYNSYPNCYVTSCNAGYVFRGSGATATCAVSGGGGVISGGGVATIGLVSSPSPSPSPSATPASSAGAKLIRYAGDPKVYVIENGQKRWIQTGDDFTKLGYNWSDVKIAPASETYPDGAVMKVPSASSAVVLIRYAGDPKVYVVENNQKHWIKTADDFNKLGYKWSDIKIAPANETYTTGSDKTAAISAATFTQTLKRNSKGTEVLALQQKLKDLGYFPTDVEIFNNFGPTTQKAVKALQKANGLSQTGIVDAATRALLNK